MGKLKVTICRHTGEISVKGEGFSGPQCLEKSRDLLRRLGTISSQEKTPEFYEEVPLEDSMILEG